MGFWRGLKKFSLGSCKEAETCVIMADFAAEAVSLKSLQRGFEKRLKKFKKTFANVQNCVIVTDFADCSEWLLREADH